MQTLLNPNAWYEVGRNFVAQLPNAYLFHLMLALVLAAFWLRRHVRSALIRASEAVGKPAGGNFSATLKALFYSMLLPVAPVLLMLLLAWQLKQGTVVSPYADALAEAMYWAAKPVYSLLLLRALACRRGVLEAHFRWRLASIQRLRKAINFLLATFIPASMLTIVLVNVESSGLAGILLKFSFMAAALSQSFSCTWFSMRKGRDRQLPEAASRQLSSQITLAVVFLAVVIPVLLVILSLMGYVYTSATLLNQVINTLWLAAGLVLQQLAEHWLLLSRRRIAYQAAVERYKAMAENKPDEHAPEGEKEVEFKEPKVDLVTLSKASRKLLNAAILIAAVVGLWLIWSNRFLPWWCWIPYRCGSIRRW